VGNLRDCFFYEFELASHNILALPNDNQGKTWTFSIVNQAIPFCYRWDYFIDVNQIYSESEYEFNE